MSRRHLNRRQLLSGAAALGLVDALRGGTLAPWLVSEAHAQTPTRAPAAPRRWQNWSGLQQATPATWATPANEAEVQQLEADIRVLAVGCHTHRHRVGERENRMRVESLGIRERKLRAAQRPLKEPLLIQMRQETQLFRAFKRKTDLNHQPAPSLPPRRSDKRSG